MAAVIGAILEELGPGDDGPGETAAPAHAGEMLDRFQRERSSPAQIRVSAMVEAALRERFAAPGIGSGERPRRQPERGQPTN